MIRSSLLAALLLPLAIPGLAFAQIERQHEVHVHGTATGNLAVDEDILRLELEIPGINLVGFEHPPVDADQQASLDQTIEFLRSAVWLEADPQGQCEIATVSAHAHGFDGGDGHDHHHDHEHHEHHEHHQHHEHHEHGDGHDHSAGHAEFHLVVTMECGETDRLSWVDLQLFDRYPGNEEVQMDVLTSRLATQISLTAAQPRIELDG